MDSNWIGIGIVCVFIGLMITVNNISLYRKIKNTDSWLLTDGKILSSEAKMFTRGGGGSDGDITVYFLPIVLYRYNVLGRNYDGDNVYTIKSDMSEHRAEAVASSFVPGEMVRVYYDPKHPERSSLEKTSIGSKRGVWVGLGLMAFGLAELAASFWPQITAFLRGG